jgi:hypothetical protein
VEGLNAIESMTASRASSTGDHPQGIFMEAPTDHLTAPLYHVTVLSNFARAFDKYLGRYRKSAIPESSYPNEFYVLPRSELQIGIAKASQLHSKLKIPNDTLIALESSLTLGDVQPNARNGAGFVWPFPDLPVTQVRVVGAEGQLTATMSLDEAMANSLALHADAFIPYTAIKPRSLSFLPIARGCQAACPFCFSEASASADQKQTKPDWDAISRWIHLARERGAERVVITGGGEPTLSRWEDLLHLIRASRARFEKIVLITNGVKLARQEKTATCAALSEMHDSGLSVLAVSRHHFSDDINTKLMRLETRTPALLKAYAGNRMSLGRLKLRLVCVLQRGGVESIADIDNYVAWAASFGVEEICFKELYVSTSQESFYHSHETNAWSAENRVPLSLVHEWAAGRNYEILSQLPWGAPIFGSPGQEAVRVAAYTEPSLFWERRNGIARSWNVMADGSCLASLEDRRSLLEPSSIGSA